VLDIAGGVYYEFCVYPAHSALLGSAGRAALALSSLSDRLRLHAPIEKRNIDSVALQIGRAPIEIIPRDAPGTPVFSYLHDLANPDIRGVPTTDDIIPTVEVTADNILRFGMLDGLGIVHGKRVVYDPQSSDAPEAFHKNGSTGDEIAYVCNENEALRLTGAASVTQAGERLITWRNVRAVVIKCGPFGAQWFSPAGRGWVPAIPTTTVFKIGSGDIFSATFAHSWAERRLPVEQAVKTAGEAVAYYCRNRSLPLPKNWSFSGPQLSDARSQKKEATVYLASPFFDIGARWLLEETRSAMLDMGVKVFSPLHDVGKGPAPDVAARDLKGLQGCDSVLALLDGFDTGTVFEIGYARAIGKPVVAYGETLESEQLTMLVGTGCEVAQELGTAVYRAIWRAIGG
jgi:hypothetical protein